jgi:hypothetical protein
VVHCIKGRGHPSTCSGQVGHRAWGTRRRAQVTTKLRDGRDEEERDQRSEVGGQKTDDRGRTTEDRRFKVLNIEQQNKEPQNDEVITSIFPPEADSIFCGSKEG